LYLYLIHFTQTGLDEFGVNVSSGTSPYLIGRFWSALLGTLTVILVFLIGRRLYGSGAAVGAAVLTAVVPIHVLLSHYATVDVPVTFFITLSFYFSTMLLAKGKTRYYLLSGAAAGLAAGTKYNGALVLLPLIAARFLTGNRRAKARWLVAGILTSAVVFFITTPFLISDFTIFIRDLKSQSSYLLESGHPGGVFMKTSPGFFYQLRSNLYYAGGRWFWFLSLAGLVGCFIRHRRSDLILLPWIIPYFILISIPVVKFARFILPLTPFLALGAGALLQMRLPGRRSQRLVRILFSVGIIWILLISLGYLRTLAGPDPRITANRWLREFLPAGTRVGQIKTETGLIFLDDPPPA